LTSEYENLSCSTLPECVILIEDFLASMAMDSFASRQQVDTTTLWSINLGEIPVYISLLEDETIFFAINTFLIQIPEKNREPLLLKCLQLNRSMMECYFSLDSGDNILRLEHSRHALGLDRPELTRAFASVLAFANKYRDEFINDFGGIEIIPK